MTIDAGGAAGGLAIKWVAPGLSGVPDRVVLLPGGQVFFAEIKAPGKRLTALQQQIIGMMRDLGAHVYVVDSMEAVDALFTLLRERVD